MDNDRLAGTVQSGGTEGVLPLAGAAVTLFHATLQAPRTVATATTDASGRFEMPVTVRDGDGIYYAAAEGGHGVRLVAIIGASIDGPVVINELTTVAAAYAMAQLTEQGAIQGAPFRLRIAAGMSENLVEAATGTSSEVMLRSPNADETNALRSTRALANLLLPSVRGEPGAFHVLQGLATTLAGGPPADTFQALVNIARHPARQVGGIFKHSRAMEAYLPSLAVPPDAWTLAVKVNDSGSDEQLFGGPANIAWDRNGYAWVANNVVQGTPNSAHCVMVLRPDGRPADGRDGTPRSPLSGGGILGVGFGVTVAPDGHVWFGNFGWGDPDTQYPASGSASRFTPAGRPASPPDGFIGGTYRVQGVAADADGNIWLASFGNNTLAVFPGGQVDHAILYPHGPDPDQAVGTFAVAPAEPGSAWVTYAGGLGWPPEQQSPSRVRKFRFAAGKLECTLDLEIGSVTKGVALDSAGNAWVASGGDDTVYHISPDGATVAGYGGGGVSGPWDVAIDGDGHVWVANFGPMGPLHDYARAGVSQLAGIDPPPGLRTGDPMSPQTGYTLPSAGSEVLLHNLQPLNGPGGEPCYSPLMRMTSVSIDQAGNVWAVNNWKPNFATDFLPGSGNPGGDGLVIFVGLAKPPELPRPGGTPPPTS